jgi:membrane associated rhomboid family serine protease
MNNIYGGNYGSGYRPQPGAELRAFFRRKDAFARLLIINLAVMLVVSFVRLVAALYQIPDALILDGYVMEYLAVPADIHFLPWRVWTVVTYMFLHVDFFHILFNMLWFYWFGKIFLEYFDQRFLMINYLAGGAAGVVMYLFFYNTFPLFDPMVADSRLLGASAAVMAVVAAVAFYVPDYSVQLFLFGRIKVFYIALALFIIDFFMITGNNAGGHLAHIGGALWGYLFVRLYTKGYRFRLRRMNLGFSKPKMNKTYSSGRPVSDEEYRRRKIEEQEQIDNILDKIKLSGYNSLTAKEKELLFRASNKK